MKIVETKGGYFYDYAEDRNPATFDENQCFTEKDDNRLRIKNPDGSYFEIKIKGGLVIFDKVRETLTSALKTAGERSQVILTTRQLKEAIKTGYYLGVDREQVAEITAAITDGGYAVLNAYAADLASDIRMDDGTWSH